MPTIRDSKTIATIEETPEGPKVKLSIEVSVLIGTDNYVFYQTEFLTPPITDMNEWSEVSSEIIEKFVKDRYKAGVVKE
jgi:hypothetical protein